MRGKVDVQSRALRSYRAVVMLTAALFAVGMLKLASRMFAVVCLALLPYADEAVIKQAAGLRWMTRRGQQTVLAGSSSLEVDQGLMRV